MFHPIIQFTTHKEQLGCSDACWVILGAAPLTVQTRRPLWRRDAAVEENDEETLVNRIITRARLSSTKFFTLMIH